MTLKTATAASLIALGLFALPVSIAAYAADSSAALKAVDTDSDGTIDLAEAKKAGQAKFDKLNPDNDGSLDSKEAAGLDLKKLDPDNDGKFDKAEYAAAVEAAFKKATPDSDGTVDAKELASPEGQELLALIQ